MSKLRIFAIALIALGLIYLIGSNFLGQMVAKEQKEGIFGFEGLTSEEIALNQGIEAEYDYGLIRDVGLNVMMANLTSDYKQAIVGLLVAPTVDTYMPILKGTTDKNLLVGSTTMRPDQKMGQGNYPLSGHYNLKGKVFFGAIMDLEKGDPIFITDKSYIYEYEVYEKRVVKDTDVHLIEDAIAVEHGQPIISLMTCNYTSRHGERFFAFAELVDKYPYEDYDARIPLNP